MKQGYSEEGIISNLMKMDPIAFENLVGDLFDRMGYEAELTKQSSDGGIDLSVSLTTPAGDSVKYVVQVKRYQEPVGVRVVRELLGSMTVAGADKCIFVTTSSFTKESEKLAEDANVLLIDGCKLAELIVNHGLGQLSDIAEDTDMSFATGTEKRVLVAARKAVDDKRYVEAIEMLRSVSENSKNCGEALRIHAEAKIGMADYKTATQLLNKAIEINDRDAEAWYLLGFNMGKLNLISKGIEFMARAHYLDDAKPQYEINKAFLLLKAGRGPEATEIAMRLLQKNVEDSKVLHLISGFFGATGRHSLAVRTLDDLLRRDPEFMDAYADRGVIKLYALRDYSGAIKDLKRYLSHNHDNVWVWGSLGLAVLMTGKHYEAHSYFLEMKSLAKTEHEHAQADDLLGGVQAFIDDPDPAIHRKIRATYERDLSSWMKMTID